ncbi:MAG: hypothetical protein IPK64_21925 [bacterium]|nr:hypothetical protein [bacterium]
MAMPPPVPPEVFSQARAAFAAAPRPPASRVSDWDRVRAVLDDILAKRAEGWSYAEIRSALVETVGFKGTIGTLYSYVNRLSAERRATARAGVRKARDRAPGP